MEKATKQHPVPKKSRKIKTEKVDSTIEKIILTEEQNMPQLLPPPIIASLLYLNEPKKRPAIEYKSENAVYTKNALSAQNVSSKMGVPGKEIQGKSYELTLIKHFLSSPGADDNPLKAGKEGGNPGMRIYQKFVREVEESAQKAEIAAFNKLYRPRKKKQIN